MGLKVNDQYLKASEGGDEICKPEMIPSPPHQVNVQFQFLQRMRSIKNKGSNNVEVVGSYFASAGLVIVTHKTSPFTIPEVQPQDLITNEGGDFAVIELEHWNIGFT